MKKHYTIMIILAVVAVAVLAFVPNLGLSRGVALILLICPLMMFGMMMAMGHNHKH